MNACSFGEYNKEKVVNYAKMVAKLMCMVDDGELPSPPKLVRKPPIQFKTERNFGFTDMPVFEKIEPTKADYLGLDPLVLKIKRHLGESWSL